MLTRKMLRDMGRHKTQFVSIFLMAFLAIFIYTGVGAEWRGLERNSNDFYAKTNLADAWLYGSGFTEEQAEAAKSISGVSAVQRRLDINATADFENAPSLSLYFIENNEICKPYLVSGEAFDAEDGDGIWPDKRFADAHGLTPGSKISLTFGGLGGITMEKTVRGLIYSSEHVFASESDAITPDFSAIGYAYLASEAIPAPITISYNTLLIKAEDTEGLEGKINAAVDDEYSVFLEQKDHPSVFMFKDETMQHKMMGDIFPIVFMLIALLTIMTTMTRIVSAQRIQIGTLKAMGFKKGVILRHYVAYGFFLALLGAAVGMITGPISLPYLFYPSMSSFYTLPEWKPAFAPAFIIVSVAVVLLCVAVCLLACAKLLRDTPAETMRAKAPKRLRHGLLERTKLWPKLGFNAQWNIRDASRNRIRSAMAVVGVFGCAALIICALTMNDCMEDLKVWQYETINRYESKLSLSETASPEQIERIIEETDGEAVMEGVVEIRAKGERKSASFSVTDDVTLIKPTDVRLNNVSLPENGVSMTLKMAESLGLKQGDAIEWHIYESNELVTSKIDAVYRDPVNQGITMTRSHFESLGMAFKPTAILSAKKISTEMDGVDFVLSTSDSITGWDDLTEALYVMVYLLIAAAAILSIVVLYNLGLLSFTEMEREFATLKVMGLKSGKLRGLLLTQNLWFSAIGFALGVPGGLWLTQIIISFSGESYDFPLSLHAATFFISLAFTFGLSIIVNLMFSRKVRKLNMVETLKALE